MKKREAELVNENLLKDSQCMNLKLGGEGGFTLSEDQYKARNAKCSLKHSEKYKTDEKYMEYRREMCRKRTIEQKLYKNLEGSSKFTGMHHTEEFKKKIGEINSKKQSGSGNSQFGKCWIYHKEFGNKIIKLELLEDHLNYGWSRGRNMKHGL